MRKAMNVASNNGSAEIVNMEDARARRRAGDLDAAAFETAGAHLRAAREAQGLSLEEVSERTHIKAAFLSAIEEMNAKTLPSRPFAVGFVKVYAEALGLNAGEIVARFKEDAGFTAPVEPEHERHEPAHAPAEAAERSGMSLLAVLGVVAFLVFCAIQIATATHDTTTPFSLDQAGAEGETAILPTARPSAIVAAEAPDGAVVVEPVLVERVSPIYPQRCELGAADVETVEVAFNVSADGLVSGARVSQSSNSCFNDAAIYAARRWKFAPKTVDGAARPAYDLRYSFRFERPL